MLNRTARVGIVVSAILAPLRVMAADTTVTPKSPVGTGNETEEVVVRATYDYLSSDTSGATNLPLPIEKVPQSISLVSQDFIKAADLRTIGQIADYTPGALNTGGGEGITSKWKLRGFNSGLAIDGVNVGTGGYEPDWAVVDRLEVVKGPSSVIYGVASAGGLINLVTKSAKPDTPSYVSLQGGSWDSFRIEGQAAGSIGSSIHLIGVAARDQGDSFTNFVNHQTTVVYGGVNADLGTVATAFVHGGFERHVRTSFDGLPTEVDGSPAPIPYSFFIGSPDMKIYTQVFHTEGGITWHATDMLDLEVKGTWRRDNLHGPAPYSFGLDADGNIGLAIQDYQTEDDNSYGVGASAVYRLDALGLKDSFISVSALYQDDQTTDLEGQGLFDGQFTGSANIFDGEAAIARILDGATRTGTEVPNFVDIRTITYSGQSIVKALENVSLLFGASWCRPATSDLYGGVRTDYNFASHMSYRAGLIYEFLPGTNAYVSYSQSFQPQGYIDVNGATLPPLQGDQYEAGIKYRAASGRLLVTGAAFQITQKNQAEYDSQVNGLDRFKAIGEVKHKGVELEATGHVTRAWQVHAGYTYLDPKITKDTNTDIVGQTDIFLPKQTASVFSEYTFNGGFVRDLTVGAGAHYVGPQRTALDGSTRDLPGYPVIDLTSGYVLDKWSLRLNVHNLLNHRYFINNYQTLFYGNTVGDPTNFSVTLRRDF